MTFELNNKIESVIKMLTKLQEVSSTEIIDKSIHINQLNRINSIVTKYNISNFDLNDANALLNEEFGGSFGLLQESSPLLNELRIYHQLQNEAKSILKSDILNKFIFGDNFKSQPIIKYTERHGGPLWFNLEQVEIIFSINNLINMKFDRTLSKTMNLINDPVKYEKGKFEIIHVLPNFISGNIELNDGRLYYFETLQDMNFLFLENKKMTNESIVVARQKTLNI